MFIGIAIVGYVIAIQSGWVIVPSWFSSMRQQQEQSLRRILYSVAMSFEQTGITPPTNGVQIIEDKLDHWGTPVQYSYEDGIPTLRAAGRDKKLNTKDDIIQQLHNQRVDLTPDGAGHT